jgi:hypothetical protein
VEGLGFCGRLLHPLLECEISCGKGQLDQVAGPEVHPVLIRTPMTAGIPDDRGPMGRPADPTEVATFVLFLGSDESGYSTGSEFIVDGGLVTAVPGKAAESATANARRVKKTWRRRFCDA